MKQLKLKKFGFTFIEILVVVTIIGVLVMIGSVSYSSANKKSRDGKRKADMEQIRVALEMYRADVGTYPATAGLDVTSCTGSLTYSGNTYLDPIPCDPLNNATYYYSYACVNPFTTYTISATLEAGGSYSKTQP